VNLRGGVRAGSGDVTVGELFVVETAGCGCGRVCFSIPIPGVCLTGVVVVAGCDCFQETPVVGCGDCTVSGDAFEFGCEKVEDLLGGGDCVGVGVSVGARVSVSVGVGVDFSVGGVGVGVIGVGVGVASGSVFSLAVKLVRISVLEYVKE